MPVHFSVAAGVSHTRTDRHVILLHALNLLACCLVRRHNIPRAKASGLRYGLGSRLILNTLRNAPLQQNKSGILEEM
jgi:hypothetical protein